MGRGTLEGSVAVLWYILWYIIAGMKKKQWQISWHMNVLPNRLKQTHFPSKLVSSAAGFMGNASVILWLLECKAELGLRPGPRSRRAYWLYRDQICKLLLNSKPTPSPSHGDVLTIWQSEHSAMFSVCKLQGYPLLHGKTSLSLSLTVTGFILPLKMLLRHL